jgi:hypothetical protein
LHESSAKVLSGSELPGTNRTQLGNTLSSSPTPLSPTKNTFHFIDLSLFQSGSELPGTNRTLSPKEEQSKLFFVLEFHLQAKKKLYGLCKGEYTE